MENFKKELAQLINKHSIENKVDMPDFILAEMLCRMIETMGPSIKANIRWWNKEICLVDEFSTMGSL
jgi:hypothetical protein